MPLSYLVQLRPLFLIAVALSVTAGPIMIRENRLGPINASAMILLAVAVLALAVVSICAQRASWAKALAVRPDADPAQVNPCLFFIGFIDTLISVWLVLSVYQPAR